MSTSSSAAALPDLSAAAPVSVLVADDDPTSRILVGAALDGHVRSVVEAENGFAAVQEMEQQSFDLAIVDLDMPVMDGFGVIERARARAETLHLPIIVITGRDDVVAIERAFALGATSFLCKPINWNIFRHQVGYVLQVARVERETRAAKERAESLATFRARGLTVLEKEIAETVAKVSSLSGNNPDPGLADIFATGERLQAVLTRVKWAANVLTGNALFEPRTIRAGELADAAVERIAAGLGPSEAKRIVTSGGGGLEVLCDRPLAADALVEVLDNALAFSPAGSPVHLGIVQAPAHRVRFEIRDHGAGIPEHILERGFESFRTGSGGVGGRVGLGLGLPTARTIVERHGGYFSLMSEAGNGTEVFLSFPSRPEGVAVKNR